MKISKESSFNYWKNKFHTTERSLTFKTNGLSKDCSYDFQLDESNLSNKINYISTNLQLKKFNFANNFLLIRKGALSNQALSQNTLKMGYKITPKLTASGSVTRNLVADIDILRRISLSYGGCCITTEFSIAETNTSNLIQRERSFNLNILIKGL